MRREICLFAALSLCICCLAGCGKKETASGGLYGRASGIPEDTALAQVDGRTVTARQYFYWLAYDCDYIQADCARAGTVPDWDSTFSGGTLGSYAKGQALRTAALYATVENWAERYGCTLTEEDRAAWDAQRNAAVEKAGGEKAYLAGLEWMGLDDSAARQISEDYYLYSHLNELYGKKDSALCPAEGAVSQWAAKEGLVTAAEIRFSAGDGGDSLKSEKKKQAEALLAKLKAAADPAAAFLAAAESGAGDPERAAESGGRTFAPDDGTVPAAVSSAAAALEENQLSGVVEADGAFYLLLRRPLDAQAASAAYFDHLLQAAADGAKITLSDAYGKIDAGEFYQKLAEERKKLPAGGPSAFSPEKSGGEAASGS